MKYELDKKTGFLHVDRLRHYFSIYKALTPEEAVSVKVDKAYGRDHAIKVVQAAAADYEDEFGE